MRYAGPSWDGSGNNRVPSVTLLDLLVSYDTGPWALSLNVNNLTDKVQITTCLARGDCFYGPRRTVVASMRYAF